MEVRDLGSGKTLYTRTIALRAGGLAFSGDGRTLIASGCCDGRVDADRVGRAVGREAIRRATTAGRHAFAVSPVGRTLAVGTDDGRVMLLDARTGRQRWTR